MSIDEFFNQHNGKGIDFDNFYGFQCMDLANLYNQDVVGAPRLTGNAVDVWKTYPHDKYDEVTNTPDGVPTKGDIIIWGQGVGPYGHIAVFKEGDTNSFTSFDQNWPLNSLCHFQNHNYNGVLGWLHPKQPATTTVSVSKEDFERVMRKSAAYDKYCDEEKLDKDSTNGDKMLAIPHDLRTIIQKVESPLSELINTINDLQVP